MPTIVRTSLGTVSMLWGHAFIRGNDGRMRALKAGDVVQRGDVILTEQDAIVQISDGAGDVVALTQKLQQDHSDADATSRVIDALESGSPDAAPGAGAVAGAGGDSEVQEGYRVGRIVETVGSGSLVSTTPLDAAPLTVARDADTLGAAAAAGSGLAVSSGAVTAVESGPSVGLPLQAPTGGGSLSVVVTQSPSLGQIVTNDGRLLHAGDALSSGDLAGLRYAPPADLAPGTDVGAFSYRVSDGRSTADGTVVISVTPVNDAPTARDLSGSSAEDTTLPIALTGSDVDGSIAHVVVTSLPAAATLLLADGVTPVAAGTPLSAAQAATLVLKPAPDFHGALEVRFVVVDDAGATSAPGVARYDVTPVNDLPIANDDRASTLANTPVTLGVLSNDRDADGDALTISAASVAADSGSVVVNADGTLTFTPAPGVTGPVVVSYTATDPSGGSDTARVTVEVGTRVPPTVTVAAPASTADPTPTLVGTTDQPAGSLVTLTIIDAVGHVQTLQATVQPGGGFSADVPDDLPQGGYTVQARITDAAGLSATANGSGLVDLPDPPVARPDTLATTEDAPLTITAATLFGNDTDADGDALTVTSVQDAVNGTVALVGGHVVFTPNANYAGPARFTYTVGDGNGGSSTAVVELTVDPVNDPPAATADALSTIEDVALTIAPATLLANDTDVDGNPLTIASVQGAVHGSVALVSGNVVFTPDADYSGPARFTYTLSDDQGATSTIGVDVGVAPVNDPPAATGDAFSTDEDTAITLVPAALLGNDIDVEGDTLTIASVQDAVGGNVALAGGNVVFTPAANYNGPASFSYTVSDGNGGTSTATVTVAVNPLNDPPAANGDALSTSEDSPLTIVPATLLGNDTDVDGNPLTIVSVQGALNGTVALVAGNVVFTPAAHYAGPASFTYTVSDGNGGTSTAAVDVTVDPVNDAPAANPDALATAEDTVLVLAPSALLGNDTDIDIDTVTITSVQGAVNGTVALVGGNVVFTPNADFNGLASFSYTVSDGHGGASTATATVAVMPAKDPPAAAAEALSTNEDVPLIIPVTTLLGNDGDVDGDALFVASVQGAVNGSVTLSGGNVIFKPNADYNGPASFSYTVSDGHGGTSTATVDVTVNAVDDPPAAVNDMLSAVEDTALTISSATLLGNDTDLDGPLTLLSVQGAIGGTVTLSGSTIVFTPAADFNGPASFTYTVSDGQGGTSTATVGVNVAPANDPPAATAGAMSTAEDTPLGIATATLLGNDVDIDGDTLSVTSVQDAVNGTVALAGSTIVFTPAPDFNGTASFSYTVSDGHGASSTATVTVQVGGTNDPPVAFNDTLAAVEDTALVIAPATLLANDIDGDGDALTIQSVQGAVNGTVAIVAGNAVFTPSANFNGPASFTYTVADGYGGQSTATVSVMVAPVNDPPAAASESLATNEDTAVTISAATLLGNDTDIDGNTLTISSVQSAVGGSATLSGAHVVFTPIANYNGPASFTYTVSDGQGGTSTATVTVNVAPVNDGPVASADAVSTHKDTAIVLTPSALLGNDTDVDGDSLSITSVQGAVNGTVALSGGNVVFTPDANYNGPASFTYTVSDGHGGLSTATVSVTVAAVNDPPVAEPDSVSTNEDTPLPLLPATLLGNDADVEGNALSITSVQGAVNGAVAIVGGNVVFTPATNYNGPASFTYTVSDGNGGSSTATASVTVNPVNDTPVASADVVTTDEDTAVSIPIGTLLGNDTDVDGDTLSLASVQSAVNGSVAIVAGNVVFTPNANYNGPASFTYTVGDGNGGTSTATVNISVVAVNDPPLANADSVSMNEDTTLTLAPSALLGNDTDVDGNPLSITSVQGAVNGTVALVAGNVVFTPNANDNGPASFTYTVSDGNGGNSTTTVNVTVAAVNDPPVAAGNVASTNEDTPVTITTASLLANDTDVESNTLTVTSVQAAVGGTVNLSGANVVFTPAPNFNGAASFTYTIFDGKGGTSTAAVSVTVNPVNDVPVASADTLSTNEDTALTIAPAALLFNDTDVDGDSLSITSVQGAVNGTAAIVAGNVVFTPNANYNGPASFTYTVSDGHGGNSTATVNLTVAAVNDAPITAADTVSTNEDTPLTIAPGTLLGNDTDADGDSLSITSVQGAVNGTTAIVAGDVVFTPNANYNGPAGFTYTVADGHGGTSTASVVVNVASVNDAPVAAASAISGVEDQFYTFSLANFSASDVDGTIASVTITSLPVLGDLYFNGSLVTTTGLTVTAADFAAGRLQFRADPNESGADAYASAGTGNLRNDYTAFGFTVSDHQGAASGTATMTVDVAPRADATSIGQATIVAPTANGLTKAVYNSVAGLNANGSQTFANIEPAVEGTAIASSSVIAGITTANAGGLATDSAVRVSGFVYLQAGNTYTFGGTFGDTLGIEVGGSRVFAFAHDGDGSDTENVAATPFVPPVSGYYSVEVISYNASGSGGFVNLTVAVNGGAAQAFTTASIPLYADAASVTGSASGSISAFVQNPSGEAGSGYYALRGGSAAQGQSVLLPTLTPSFGDSADNSERHTVTLDLAGAPAGTRVFVDVNGDGVPDDGRVFTTSAGNTAVLVFDEDNPAAAVGGSNWDLSRIVIDPPATFAGSFSIGAVARADEMTNGGVADTTTSTTSIPVTMVAATNVAPNVANVAANVSEEGLTGGNPDSTGTVDTTNSATVSGTVSITDTIDSVADSITSVTLLAPNGSLTAGGVAVAWTGAGTNTLVGSAGGQTVATLTINNAGAYTFTLARGIDHSDPAAEDVRSLNFGVVASDGVNNRTGTLTINVEDDSPVAASSRSEVATLIDSNLLIVLDVSGSMTTTDGINGTTRLATAVSAINTLLDGYDEFGNVAVRLVTFSSAAAPVGTVWTDVATAKSQLATLVATGGTNYDAALASAQTAFNTTTGRLTGAQNVGYFFSDGAPTEPSGSVGVSASEETAWTTFLNNNAMKAYAVGLGSGVSSANLDPIAYDGQISENLGSTVVSDYSQLNSVLAGTVDPVEGSLMAGGSLSTSTSGVGGDGGYVHSVSIEGTTYTYDPFADAISASAGANRGTFVTSTNVLTVTTTAGGRFEVDMDDGTYVYRPPSGVSSALVEHMDFTVTDRDGDKTSAAIDVTVDHAGVSVGSAGSETMTGGAGADFLMARGGDDTLIGNAGNDRLAGGDGNDIINGLAGDDKLYGGRGNDTLNGGDGNDLLDGGVGSDQLTGGAGADVFSWSLADRGAAGSAPTDTITDFNNAANGDSLDLRDLLVGEHAGTLSNYLHFTTSGGSTTIQISTTGGFLGGFSAGAVDQVIQLTGVNLVGGFTTDSQVIHDLLTRGKLVTDA